MNKMWQQHELIFIAFVNGWQQLLEYYVVQFVLTKAWMKTWSYPLFIWMHLRHGSACSMTLTTEMGSKALITKVVFIHLFFFVCVCVCGGGGCFHLHSPLPTCYQYTVVGKYSTLWVQIVWLLDDTNWHETPQKPCSCVYITVTT